MRNVTPRLFNVTDACAYLGGISDATIRRLIAKGVLCPVRLPSVRRPNETGRRLLFAREDLDALIDEWKRESMGEPNVQLSAAALEGWKRTPVRQRRNRG